jgi:hypothetical protein
LCRHDAQTGYQRQSQDKQRDLPPQDGSAMAMLAMKALLKRVMGVVMGVMVCHGNVPLRADNQNAIGILRTEITLG